MPVKKKIFLTPDQEAALRDVYENGKKGRLTRLAKAWGMLDRTLSYYAKHRLGLPSLSKYYPHIPWSDLEISILEKYPHLTNLQMTWRLRKLTGKSRTVKSVEVERSRRGLSQIKSGDDDNLSINLIAAGLGMNTHAVYRWAQTGVIPAFRKTPNGRWYVTYENLRAFLLDRKNWHRWNVKKADHLFLMDILSDGAYSSRIAHVEGRGDAMAEHHLAFAEAA